MTVVVQPISMTAGERALGVSRAALGRMLRGALLLLVLSLVPRLWAQAHVFDDTTGWGRSSRAC